MRSLAMPSFAFSKCLVVSEVSEWINRCSILFWKDRGITLIIGLG